MEMITRKLVEGAEPQAERTHPGGRMDRYLRLIDTFPSFFKLDSASYQRPPSTPSFTAIISFPAKTFVASPYPERCTAWLRKDLALQLQLFYPGDAVGEECKTSKYDTSGDEEWQCLGGDGVVGGG